MFGMVLTLLLRCFYVIKNDLGHCAVMPACVLCGCLYLFNFRFLFPYT